MRAGEDSNGSGLRHTRRALVLGGAAAASLLGSGGRHFGADGAWAQRPPEPARARPGSAPAAKPAGPRPFARFEVGRLKVVNIHDGIWEKPHDPTFIRNASIDDTRKALTAARLADAHVPMPFTVTLVDTGRHLVMFDAGTGGQVQPTAGRLAEGLAAAGIAPERIDTIAVTHFHADHVYGLMVGDGDAPAFPKARIVVPEAEYRFWIDSDRVESLPPSRKALARRIQAVFPAWKERGLISFVPESREIAPGITSLATPGHTPGHTSYLAASGKSQLLVLGDVAALPALFVRNPGWHASFDADPVLAERTRRAMLERAVSDKLLVTGYHFGMPGAGTIKKDGAGYTFVPLKV
jgi:glyoxylase-like metal-dependent hydrolase (beta-lactamase superfamily II)